MPFRRRRSDPPPATSDRFTAEALAHLDALYGTALRLTRSQDAAHDLVQDTYLKAFRGRARFASGTNLKAWLYTILHNTWRNRRRDQARDAVDVDSERVEVVVAQGIASSASIQDTPEDVLVKAALSEDLRTALDGLPEAFRETIWLRDVEELTYQEIAAVLDVPMGTVMSRLSRGRRLLHEALIAAGRNARGRTAS
jgi:RNA polymerase sigma-70 factor (ECF subfamily)